MRPLALPVIAAALLPLSASAIVFSGNGNTGFGGVLGNGSLEITDDGTNLNFKFNRGSDNFNDFLVLYIDSPAVAAGATTLFTSGEVGSPFAGRRAIVNEFGSGISLPITASHAFALKSSGSVSNHLFSIAGNSDNANGLGFVNTYAITNFGSVNASSYQWSIPVANLGMTPLVGGLSGTINFVATYLNPNSGTGFDASFRSDEALTTLSAGNPGFNNTTLTQSLSYTIIPEPASAALALIGFGGLLVLRRTRR
jgi:hypothetical protein